MDSVVVCPEISSHGIGCGGSLVRRIDGSRSRTCWAHLTSAEKDQISLERVPHTRRVKNRRKTRRLRIESAES